MCRISVSYDTAKRDIVKKNQEGSGMSLQDAVRLYLDVLSNGKDVEDLKAYLIKKKVESDSEDTVYHFDQYPNRASSRLHKRELAVSVPLSSSI